MQSDTFPQQPMTRRKRRTTGELLEAAKKIEEKALERAARKKRHVQKYEAVQKARERKLRTRTCIIVGALAWEHRLHDALFNKVLLKLLDDYVLKDDERALVGLPPLPPEELARLLAEQEVRAKARRRTKG